MNIRLKLLAAAAATAVLTGCGQSNNQADTTPTPTSTPNPTKTIAGQYGITSATESPSPTPSKSTSPTPEQTSSEPSSAEKKSAPKLSICDGLSAKPLKVREYILRSGVDGKGMAICFGSPEQYAKAINEELAVEPEKNTFALYAVAVANPGDIDQLLEGAVDKDERASDKTAVYVQDRDYLGDYAIGLEDESANEGKRENANGNLVVISQAIEITKGSQKSCAGVGLGIKEEGSAWTSPNSAYLDKDKNGKFTLRMATKDDNCPEPSQQITPASNSQGHRLELTLRSRPTSLASAAR